MRALAAADRLNSDVHPALADTSPGASAAAPATQEHALSGPAALQTLLAANRRVLQRPQAWMALLLATGCLFIALGYLLLERAELRQEALSRVEWHARVLEHDSNAQLNALAQTLLHTQQAVLRATESGTPRLDRLLEETRRGQAALDGLFIADAQGQIVASSGSVEAKSRVALPSAPHGPSTDRVVLGPQGSSTTQAIPGVDAAAQHTIAQGLSLLLPIARPQGENGLLVAQVNLQTLAAHHETLIGESASRSALMNQAGLVLHSGRSLGLEPGFSLRERLPYTEFYPERNPGAHFGRGLGADKAAVSIRPLRDWPLLVSVEWGQDDVHRSLLQSAARCGLLLLVAWSAIAAFLVFLIRTVVREEEEVRRSAALHQQIAEKEERWKLALDGAGDGVWDWDLHTRRMQVSATTSGLLGYAAGSIGDHSKDWYALIHPGDRGSLEEAWSALLAGRLESLRAEIRMHKADGSWGWFLVRGNRVDNPNSGTPSHRVAGTLTDITERHEVEVALRESEARAHDTFERAAVGMLHQSLDQRFLRANQRLCELVGMSRPQLLALSFRELAHPDDRFLTEEELAHLVSGELDSLVREGRVRHKEGHYFWVRTTSSLAHGPGTEEPYVICVVEDVHQRKIFEKERQELLLRFRDTANELSRHRLALDKHTMVSMLDAHGVVKYVNSRLCEVSGYAAEELLGAVRVFPEQSGPGDNWLGLNPRPVLAELHHSLREGKVWQGELLHSKKAGDPYWAATTVVPIAADNGRLEQVFVLQTDITRRVNAERAEAEARNVELRIGANIQQSLLATVLDQRLPRTWLSAYTRPSQGIDGDFLHVITVGNDCVDIVAADVMGKGIGAALIGASAKMQLGQCMAQLMADAPDRGRPEPVEVVQTLHRAMVPSLRDLEAFITICYLRIDSAADTITWVGCGHEEPWLVRASGELVVLSNRHPPMGVLDEVTYEQDTAAMGVGDALFSCSDGLCDAVKPDGTRVGRDAVEAALRRRLQRCRAPGAVVHALHHELAGPEVRAVDDTSLLLAVRTAHTTLASRRELPYTLEGLAHVRGLVEHRCASTSLSEAAASLFVLACVEAFTNIVRHNQGRVGESKVELMVKLAHDRIEAELVYVADPVQLPTPRTLALEDYPEGGFGLSIMHAATDELIHEHRDGINTIRLVKRYAA